MARTSHRRRAFVIALMAALGATGPLSAQESGSGGAGSILSVLSDAAAPSALGRWQARALLEPLDEAVISGQIDARIDEMPLKEGDRFVAGDLLIRFDCGLHEAELAAAIAERRSAERTLQNSRRLAGLNSIGELEVQLAEDGLAKAEAQEQSARIIVERCTIAAPYPGRVVETLARRYESIKRGQELITILDDSELEVHLVVPSAWLSWLKPDTPFVLDVDETGTAIDAVVRMVGARIDPVSQTIKVRGTLAKRASGLLAGMSGTATFRVAVATD